MKKILVLSLALLFVFAGSALAAGKGKAATGGIGGPGGMAADVTIGYASEPDFFEAADSEEAGLGGAIGFGAGFTMDMSKQLNMPNLALRADITYFSWSKDETILGYKYEWSLTRMPLFVGGRYFFPSGNMMMFAEAGLELDFISSEVTIPEVCYGGFCVGGGKAEDSTTEFGITPGAGIVFPIGNNMTIGANARYHLIEAGYFSLGASVGMGF